MHVGLRAHGAGCASMHAVMCRSSKKRPRRPIEFSSGDEGGTEQPPASSRPQRKQCSEEEEASEEDESEEEQERVEHEVRMPSC